MDFTILVVDGERGSCERLQASLEREGWAVSWCPRAEQALIWALEQPYDAIVVALSLAEAGAALALCRRLTQTLSDTPVILLAEHGGMDAAVSALRAGVCDVITELPGDAELRACIEECVRRRYRREAIRRLAQMETRSDGQVGQLTGQSPAMGGVYDLIRRLAGSDTTVLIGGESGTGKELVARALHQLGPRAQEPFVAINCAAVPAHLLESELFGHVRGSFTDAVADRRGLFHQAMGGSLFLDEIGELPVELQPKLLRVLQERCFRPVGGDATIAMRSRIIVATNRDLEQQVANGQFRADLYFRLNVVPIRLPPLRERGNDILKLANQFTAEAAERLGKASSPLSPEVAEKLLDYNWPGNVRQLQNVMERAVALAQGARIEVQDLPARVAAHVPTALSASQTDGAFVTLDQHEQLHIAEVLRRVRGNKTQAAQLLGVDRRTLYRKLLRYRAAHSI